MKFKTINKPIRGIDSGEERGLFANGVLAASYYRSGQYWVVNVWDYAKYHIERQAIVEDEAAALAMCESIWADRCERWPSFGVALSDDLKRQIEDALGNAEQSA